MTTNKSTTEGMKVDLWKWISNCADMPCRGLGRLGDSMYIRLAFLGHTLYVLAFFNASKKNTKNAQVVFFCHPKAKNTV